MKAAVFCNPVSGRAGQLPEVCAALRTFLEGFETIGAYGYGGELFHPDTLIETDADAGYIEKLHGAVDKAAALEPDLYVVAGGDGMAAYIADRLLTTRPDSVPSFVGIAMGTANAGPIISIDCADLGSLKACDLQYEKAGAIEAFTGGAHAAFGFNDIVIGNTLLGTVDGKPRTLCAAALCRNGEKVPTDPLAAFPGTLVIKKNGSTLASPSHSISQLIASTIERENFYARAITGVLCYTNDQPFKAAVYLAERPIVSVDPDPRGFSEFAVGSQLLLTKDDTITVEGLPEEVLIISDGNPYLIADGSLSLRYAPGLIRIGKVAVKA